MRDLAPSLEMFFSWFEDAPVKTISELIQWNKEHADIELPESEYCLCQQLSLSKISSDHPGQQLLESTASSKMTQEEYEKILCSWRRNAITSINKTFMDNNLNVIIGPEDARFSTVAMAAGFPVGAMPLGLAEFNGRAFGMEVIARAGGEDQILRFMSAWETLFPRKPPPMLVDWDSPGGYVGS